MADHQRHVATNLSAVLDGLTDDEVARLAELSRQASDILRKTGFRHIVPE